jgi:hypothetical protein
MTADKPNASPQKSERRRIGKLKTASDVAKYIARCIRKTEGGGDENRQYKQVMMASLLLKALEASSLEVRISKLEESQINRRGSNGFEPER